ncbi:family 1 glycosylhydrolase [Homoserinibacter sp. GY 40078]|uniref:family 1 glycosylhydrolase n=1 Tax=Homoserinibacter sp. GY 40078 TaxID=2603275 RepID=UPI0011C85F27|nr:family 1 glycosylhydrolase [Homoserinibacter sp. GY 40078]TXK19755.1 family 1 glycosylhydrolase [Homoserinibacter sp. GY 40078]
MSAPGELFAPGGFAWILGIEDTCVYPADGGVSLDEHALTEHDVRRPEDLRIAARLGAHALRYGVSWPIAHPEPAVFRWDELDEAVAEAEILGIELIADLVHYGTPTWLTDSFADPGYPDAIARFAGAFAARYAGRVRYLTPLNEPITTASFCGLRGVWPPRLTGWAGWVRVAVPMAEGMARTIRAVREAAPDTRIVHVEASTHIDTEVPGFEDEAQLLRGVGWLPTDLLMGRVDESHPLRDWLVAHGADVAALDRLVVAPEMPDVIGVNYYPDLTPRTLVDLEGGAVQLAYDAGAAGLRRVLTAFADRYELPLAVTETSIEGDDEVRRAWLLASADAVRELRAEGVDVRGYTWWPLFDFVDWSWAAGGANVEEFAVARRDPDGSVSIGMAPPLGDPRDGKTAFLRRMGLVRLEELSDGTLERRRTPAAEAFAALAGVSRAPEEPGGPGATEAPS